MNTPSVVLLDELKSLSIEELLHIVLQQGTALTVQLPTGETVIVQPQLPLLPLPILDGFMPEGWKDAIYFTLLGSSDRSNAGTFRFE